jgi:hypothetical protein
VLCVGGVRCTRGDIAVWHKHPVQKCSFWHPRLEWSERSPSLTHPNPNPNPSWHMVALQQAGLCYLFFHTSST